MSENKRLERLRWALRYVLFHPEISPDILSEEWEISIEKSIDICSINFATALSKFDFQTEKINFENLEQEIFMKIIELK